MHGFNRNTMPYLKPLCPHLSQTLYGGELSQMHFISRFMGSCSQEGGLLHSSTRPQA